MDIVIAASILLFVLSMFLALITALIGAIWKHLPESTRKGRAWELYLKWVKFVNEGLD